MSITIFRSEQEQEFIVFWEPIKNVVLNGVSSLTATSYEPAIDEFLSWWFDSNERNPIVATTAYRKHLLDSGYKPATINKKLSAIRQLFQAAAVYGIGKDKWPLSFEVSLAIKNIKNVPQHGKLHGTRLVRSQMEQLMNAPDKTTELGRRDRAVLALLLGSGLRRSEVVGLTWGQIKQEGKSWIIVDLVGKHGRIRSPLVPKWVYDILMEYNDKGKQKERVITSYDRHGNSRGAITAQSIYRIVQKYSDECEFDIAPHDLRRTNARYLRDKGAEIEDIQHELGHSSPKTTSIYIGREGNMEALEDMWEDFGK